MLWKNLTSHHYSKEGNSESLDYSWVMRSLSREEVHPALTKSYDKIRSLPDNFIKTKAQSMGQPTSIQTNSRLYLNSFLPRTIIELKLIETK